MPENQITPRAKDFAEWYQDVIRCGDLAEPAEVVRGCMIIKPYGYAIWELIQAELDRRFKALGHENAYFPLLIPLSFLQKEAEHVEGFAMECAVVTHTGLKVGRDKVELKNELEEPYIIRPTSETIIGHCFSRWIQSHRDLPLKINQWANVMRWEMRTRMFLRTSEFLWQEGHTAHATHEEAQAEVLTMLDNYVDFAESFMAMPAIKGQKTESEKFAGALSTYTFEALMQDGKALQCGTSHDLGQNFGRAFDVMFQNQNGEREYVWQTSWGATTRLIGALIMTHSDDAGLVLPPKLAPIQVVIIPIAASDEDRATVGEAAARVKQQLLDAGIRCRLDDRPELRPGAKHYEWERKGVPIRLELGPRDLKKSACVAKRRDLPPKQSVELPLDGVAARVAELLTAVQDALLTRAREFLTGHVVKVENRDELSSALQGGKAALAHWDGTAATERRFKDEFKATIRCIPADTSDEPGQCVLSGAPSPRRVLVAQAY